MTVEHRFLLANGIRFHVATSGSEAADRPLCLFLHGFPENWYSWRHQLRDLAADAFCVAPDLRGYGETEKPRTGYDVATLAADAEALIRAFGHEPAIVVGHDWGGAIAWEVARRHPERVAKLVILNCPPAEVLFRAVFRSSKQLRKSWYIFLFQLPWFPERQLTRNGAEAIAEIFRTGAADPAVFTEEDLTVYREAMLRPGAARAALQYYRTAVRQRLLPWGLLGHLLGSPPPRIQAPGLVLWGAEDPALGLELTRDLDRQFEAPFRLERIEGCGHWTQQEKPDRVTAEIRRFLGS